MGKTAIDLDRTNAYEFEYITIWDAAKKNDVNLLKKLVKDLKYYGVNDQTYINKNTPLHSAVKYKAERAILYLLKEGGNKNIKNIKGLTPLDTIEKVQFPDRKWIKLAKKILGGQIKEFIELDKIDIDKNTETNDVLKIGKKKNIEKNKTLNEGLSEDMRLIELLSEIKEFIKNNDINIKTLFDELYIVDINDKDIIKISSYLDSNQDGKIQYKEFLKLLDNESPEKI